MKKLFILLSVALSFMACNSNDSSTPNYIPVKVESNGGWGFVDNNGNIYLQDEFKEQPSPVYDDVFTVQENNSYTIYKMGKKPQLLGNCEDLKSVGVFSEGLIPVVREKSRISVIDSKGNEKFILSPVNGKEIVYAKCNFSDGMLIFMTEENKIGAINSSGKVTVMPKYGRMTAFSEGLALARIDDAKGWGEGWMIINQKGEVVSKLKNGIYPASFDEKFHKGKFHCKNTDGRHGFIDAKGEFTKLPTSVTSIGDFNEELYAYYDGNNMGVMNMNGEKLIRAKYDFIEILDGNTFLVKRNNKYSIIDIEENNKAVLEDYTAVNNFGGVLFARDGSDYIMLDYDGKRIGKEEFSDIGLYRSVENGSEIKTDFINVEQIIQTIASLIKSDGIGDITLGDYAYKHLKDKTAMDYSYLCNFELRPQELQGYRYGILLKYSTDKYIATSDYDYTTYNFNKDARIDEASIYLSAGANISSDASKIKDLILKKGFREEPSLGDGHTNLSNGKVDVYLDIDDYEIKVKMDIHEEYEDSIF